MTQSYPGIYTGKTPTKFWRGVLTGLLVTYLATGFFLGYGMKRNIPAMNFGGVAYYAAMWPLFIASGAYGAPAPHIPNWTFSHEQ